MKPLLRTRLLLVAIFLIALVPIWVPKYLPFGDYPFHLAGSYVIYHYNDVPFFRECYDLLGEPIPNIAEEVIIPAVMHVTDVYTAGKIFLTLSVALFTLGVYLLARNTRNGHGMWLVALAPFLYYCNQLFWGTLNFLFGLALFFVVFALWQRYRDRWSTPRFLLILALTPLLYLAHLSGYAFLLVGCGVWLAMDVREARRLTARNILSLLPLLPPLVLYALFMRGSGRIGTIVWATLGQKAVAVFPFFIHLAWIDAAVLIVLVTAAILIIVNRNAVALDKRWLALSVVFGAMFLACPRALYTSFGADVRFVVPAWIFLLLSIEWRGASRLQSWLLAVVVLVGGARALALTTAWQSDSNRIGEQVDLLSRVKPESRIFREFDVTDINSNRAVRPLLFVPNYATITRHAFTDALVAIRGQQPLVMRDSLDAYYADLNIADTLRWRYALARYDYVWYCGEPGSYPDLLRTGSDSIVSAGVGELWRIQ